MGGIGVWMAVQVSARRGCCGLRRDYWEGVIELAAWRPTALIVAGEMTVS